MSDLIRREDAIALMQRGIDGYGQKMRDATAKAEKRDWQSMLFAAVDIGAAIRALPAVQLKNDGLVKHMTGLIAAGLDRIEQLTAERDRLRGALADIVSWETMHENATVTRMANRARAGLKEASHE